MKQHITHHDDDSFDGVFRSHDSTCGGPVENEFPVENDFLRSTRSSGFLVRTPSLATATKTSHNSKDSKDTSFIESFTPDYYEDEMNQRQNSSGSPTFLRSAESATSVSRLLDSNDTIGSDLFKSQDSKTEPLPFKSTSTIFQSTGSILKDDMHDMFSSRDWVPLDDGVATKKVDDSLVAHFLQSRPTNKRVHEFLATPPSSSICLPPKSKKTKTDWSSYYEANLPPAEDPAPVSEPVSEPLLQNEKTKKTSEKSVTKKRKRKNYEPETKVYVKAKEIDVLMGRGGRSNNHKGNIRYHKEKLKIQPRYMASSKEEKTHVSQELVDIVHAWGGRFLKLENGRWYEVLNIVARKKVSQALREINTAEARRQRRARYGSSRKR